MAFMDFRDHAAHAAPTLTLAASTPASVRLAEPLSVLEQRVIELARQDRLASLRPVPKRSWLARLVFGPQPPSPMLANERLEALRRLAVVAWHHGYQLPASALREAQAAGYSEAQTGAVVDLIARLRAPVRRLAA
jgi:hypothetical protein